jgi:hypothetical protein
MNRTLLTVPYAALLAALLSACGGSSTSTPGPATQDSLVFEPAGALAIKQGSIQQVTLALNNTDSSTAGVARTVRVTTSDRGIADVFPETCTLSSVSAQSRRCLLTVHGKANGMASLSAVADGIALVQIPAAVGNSTNYGQLSVETAPGTYATGPATLAFANSGSAPYALSVKARIIGSSGVNAADNVVIRFSGPAGVTFTPAQCTVTSVAPDCVTTASLPAATATPISIAASGTSYTAYSGIAVNATPAVVTNNGTIALSTQSGNNVPNGMKAPLFVNWTQPMARDTVSVTLTLQGTGISFYGYTPGDNTKPNLSQSQTCSLVYLGLDETGNVLNCGLGLVGTAASGHVTVNAAATSSSGQTYTLGSLVLGAVAPAAAARTVTFTNNSTETIYVGITGGAAAAYTDAATPAAAATTANLKPGAASLCGPSNPQAACPLGTTCMQGGASPSTNIGNTPYYCYYDTPTPSNGYKIEPTQSTQISISSSSVGLNKVIWSGNFYPRTGCDSSSGICENATCSGKDGGLVCGPGTGPSPGINTLAELTFQAASEPDYYDVSIINGANFATEFGPTNATTSSSDSYYCGTAGSKVAQNGGYSASGNGLPAAPWTMTPTAQSFPAGATTTGDAASYFRIVIQTTPITTCTVDKDCTDAGTTCGYAMSDVVKGGFTFATRSCGRPVAWATANSIWGANQSSTNAAPFAFTTNWPKGLAGGGTVSVGDLQLCINQTYSAYVANGTASAPVQPVALACGGVMWGATQSALPIGNPATNAGLGMTYPSTPAFTANANWLDYVLPTIKWLKQACPTCYTYPFDDMTSTFTCKNASGANYSVSFSDLLK